MMCAIEFTRLFEEEANGATDRLRNEMPNSSKGTTDAGENSRALRSLASRGTSFFSHSGLSLKNKVLLGRLGAPLYLYNYRDDHWLATMFFAYPTTNGSTDNLSKLMRSINSTGD